MRNMLQTFPELTEIVSPEEKDELESSIDPLTIVLNELSDYTYQIWMGPEDIPPSILGGVDGDVRGLLQDFTACMRILGKNFLNRTSPWDMPVWWIAHDITFGSSLIVENLLQQCTIDINSKYWTYCPIFYRVYLSAFQMPFQTCAALMISSVRATLTVLPWSCQDSWEFNNLKSAVIEWCNKRDKVVMDNRQLKQKSHQGNLAETVS